MFDYLLADWPDDKLFANFNDWPVSKSLAEFEEQEKTEEIAKKCKELIEYSAISLRESEIPYDQIIISASKYPICEEQYAKLYTDYFKKNHLDVIDPNETIVALYEELKNHISPNLVYLEISLSSNTGTEDEVISSYIPEMEEDLLSKKKIEGIVDYKLFMSIIRSMGYDISMYNGDFEPTDDSLYNIADTLSYMEIKADFGRNKNPQNNTLY